MTQIRTKVRAIILAITGLIVAILIVRIGLDLFSASTSNSFIKFFFDISNPLIDQFDGVIEQSRNSSFRNVNVSAIVAIVIYAILGILISEIVTSFLYESYENIVQNLVDIFFKVLEFLVFSRIVIDFFLIQDRATFIQRINDLTNWTQDAFIAVKFLEGRVNLSAIIILIIIVVFDIVTESLIKSIFSTVGPEEHQLKKVYEPQQPNIFVGNNNPPYKPNQPLVQHININVPTGQNPYQNQIPQNVPVNVTNPQHNHIHPTNSLNNFRSNMQMPQNNQPNQYQLTHYEQSRAPLVQEATFTNPVNSSGFTPRQPISNQQNTHTDKKKGFRSKLNDFFNPTNP